MEAIRHRVGIQAPKAQVRDRLTTVDGLASWWTRDVAGDPGAGGKLEFFFGNPEPSVVMEVVETTGDRVVWRAIAGPDEWVGNDLTFDLEQSGAETVVKLTHAWRDGVDFMYHCSTKWGYFMISLKAALEVGKGTPFPGDLKISSWG